MHYYQFNIGDYSSHTRNLSLLEDLAYRRLLDEYYLHERPLNCGIASVARQIGMKDHEQEVKFVLETFFELSEIGWVNSRADKEINHFRAKIEQASRAGKASAARRLNTGSTDVQLTNNQQPITNNQEKNTKRPSVAAPVGVSPEVWESFVKHRRAKKAQLTQLVVDTIAEQAQKAGWTLEKALIECVVRNWQSFRADWVTNNPNPMPGRDVAHMTTPTPPNHDAALKKIEEDRKSAVPPPANIRAKMAELTKGMKV
jgi:uncharacterized protein YdaU (DUF1376 family)